MEAGLDSVGAIELRALLGAKFGAELPATLIFHHPTAAALATYLAGTLEVLPDQALGPSLLLFMYDAVTHPAAEQMLCHALASCTWTGLEAGCLYLRYKYKPYIFICVLWQAGQAGRAATEAASSSAAIPARVHEIVERMLGKAIGAHQVWATCPG